MDTAAKKRHTRTVRALRTRAKFVYGQRPRLSVFRSGKHMYAQIILGGETVASASDIAKKAEKKKKETPLEASARVGSLIAERALAKNIREVAFDRGGYRYHGRVKALADAARKAGLKF